VPSEHVYIATDANGFATLDKSRTVNVTSQGRRRKRTHSHRFRTNWWCIIHAYGAS